MSLAYWPLMSRQSEILCTGHTCDNKPKQSHGWTEMCGIMKWCMQMPMWDTRTECESGVSLSLRPKEIWSRRATARGCVSHWSQGLTADLQLNTPPSREAKEVLSRTLKKTLHGMVKRRSYGSMWQSPFVSLYSSVFLTPQKFWLKERIKRVI